jgi:hypothetical protein
MLYLIADLVLFQTAAALTTTEDIRIETCVRMTQHYTMRYFCLPWRHQFPGIRGKYQWIVTLIHQITERDTRSADHLYRIYYQGERASNIRHHDTSLGNLPVS